MKDAAERFGLNTIFLLAPTSNEQRIALVAEHASGFVYFVSVTGVTGARTALDKGLGTFVTRIKKHIQLPVGIGFGISTPDHVREVAGIADAVIVGSAIIKVMENNLGKPDMLEKVGSFAWSLKKATRRPVGSTE
jgi:tryptophan synthase alpha chain